MNKVYRPKELYLLPFVFTEHGVWVQYFTLTVLLMINNNHNLIISLHESEVAELDCENRMQWFINLRGVNRLQKYIESHFTGDKLEYCLNILRIVRSVLNKNDTRTKL